MQPMIRRNPQDAEPVATEAPRIIVGTDDVETGEAIRDYLSQGQPDSAPLLAPLDVVVDRASHSNSSLAVVVLPGDPARAYEPMRQLSRSLPLKVLAVGPADDPKLILRTLYEGGADEYLDAARLEEELEGALSRYRSRPAPTTPSELGQLVSVLGASGGCGSSTLAVNIAASFAKQQGTCGLIDLRLFNGDLAALLDLEPRYGLAELCSNLARLDRGLFDQFFVAHSSGIRLLAAPTSFANRELVTPQGVRQALTMARSVFPYVVADLDNARRDEQKEAVWQSDCLLLVLRLDYTSLRNVRRALDHLRYLGVSLEKIHVVANRIGQRNELSVAQAEDALGQRVLEKIPDEPARVNAAVNAGVPVVLQRPRARVSRRLASLAKQLITQSKKSQ